MPRKVLNGTVVSVKSDKTVSVLVVSKVKHAKYNKTVNYSKKYLAHAPRGECKLGSSVSIEESKPFSKLKKWLVID